LYSEKFFVGQVMEGHLNPNPLLNMPLKAKAVATKLDGAFNPSK